MTPTLRLSVKYTSNVTCQITLIGDEKKKKTVKIVRLAKKKKKRISYSVVFHSQFCRDLVGDPAARPWAMH